MTDQEQHLRETFRKTVCWAADDYGNDKATKGLSTQNSDVADIHNKLMDDDSYRATFYKYSNALSSPKAKEAESRLIDLCVKLDEKDTFFCKETPQIIALLVKNLPLIAKINHYEGRLLRRAKDSLDLSPD